jgi:hypothetical protein
MNKVIKGLAGACALLAMTSGVAQATECWSPTQAAAARVRNLQSRLMDATLRCQMVGVNITAAYNGFIATNREALRGANAVLRARLGERDYDSFVTAQANLADHAPLDEESCTRAAANAQAAMEAAGNVDALLALADDAEADTLLPGGQCGISFAAAEVTTATLAVAPPIAP